MSGGAGLRFGITTGIPELPAKSHRDLYEETITVVKAADELGFDAAWFTEHHFSRHGVDSAVLAMMAALARETRRIRLGTAVSVLPFWNPLRLAEEVAVVDILSGGRVEFGVGSGYRVHEFRGMGVDPEIRTPLFTESLALLEKAWSGEPFIHDGESYHVDCRGLRPLPLQLPHPPLWVAARSEEGIRYAGRRGAGWMVALSPGQGLYDFEPGRDLYLATAAEAGATPRIYFQVQACVAARPAAVVRAEAREWARWWLDVNTMGETIWNQGRGPVVVSDEMVDNFLEQGFHGDPDLILAQIERYAAFGVTDFSFQVAFGPPLERVLETLVTLAECVLPEARRLSIHPAR